MKFEFTKKKKDFLKILKYQVLWKSVHWGTNCFMRTETDRHGEVNINFPQFCERA